MTSFSYLQKHFEELEASMTAEERAERDRRHKETLAELARHEERMLRPYLDMERLLEPYRAIEAARASLGLADDVRGLAASSMNESIAAQVARATSLEDTAGRALACELPLGLRNTMEAAQASLGVTEEFRRRLGVPTPTESAAAQLARATDLENIVGTLGCELPLGLQSAMEVARASLGLADDVRGLAASSMNESIAGQVARATNLEDTVGRALARELPVGLHAMEAAQGSLGVTEELRRRLGVPTLTESVAAQLARATDLESIVGTLGCELPLNLGLQSAMEAARASLGLADEFRRLAASSIGESIAALAARPINMEDTVGWALACELSLGLRSTMEAARASLGLAVPGLTESITAQLVRVTAIEDVLGRIPGPLLRDALDSPHLLGDNVRRLIEPSPMDSLVADMLQREEEMRSLLGEWTDPEGETHSDPDLQTEAVEKSPEVSAPLPPPRTRPSLKERRLAAYYVFLDDVRREEAGSLILDYLVERLIALYQAMMRDVDEGRY